MEYLLGGLAQLLGLILKALFLLVLWFWRLAVNGIKLFIESGRNAEQPRTSSLEGSHGEESAASAGVASINVTPTPTAADSPEQEKAKLEALLERGSLEGLDPLTIRKLRDLAQECQRITELNDWEEKTRETEIGGLLERHQTPEEHDSFKGVEEAGNVFPIAPDITDDSGGHDEFPQKDTAVDGAAASRIVYDDYQLPDLDIIFPEPPEQKLKFTEEELLEQKQLLEAQLYNFKVRGMVVGIHPGPMITRYEVDLAPGEKISRKGLSEGLAMVLRAKTINILNPIPGKSVVGIDVPCRWPQIVYIRDVLESEEFQKKREGLNVALGKRITGDPYVADFTRAPHFLVAGQTGSGKSVCINTIIASLLVSKTPEELRIILVDPKLVELAPYRNIPHLLDSVITRPDTALDALRWALAKMDDRYEKLAINGVRNIKSFNEKVRAGFVRDWACYSQSEEFGGSRSVGGANRGEERVSEIMPYIVIIIDGYDDIAKTCGKHVEAIMARLADGALKVGIHLVLSVARPSREVVEGATKANLPCRISFRTINEINSRITLGVSGAEKLLAPGDMLCLWPDNLEPVRVHGCFINDAECEAIAEACANQHVNYPKVRTFSLEEEFSYELEDQERDEKFVDAAELVVQLKQASVSLLQRRLGIGYAKAGRIVDQLERAGIVGRERGSKPREVLMNEEELYSFLRSHEATDNL